MSNFLERICIAVTGASTPDELQARTTGFFIRLKEFAGSRENDTPITKDQVQRWHSKCRPDIVDSFYTGKAFPFFVAFLAREEKNGRIVNPGSKEYRNLVMELGGTNAPLVESDKKTDQAFSAEERRKNGIAVLQGLEFNEDGADRIADNIPVVLDYIRVREELTAISPDLPSKIHSLMNTPQEPKLRAALTVLHDADGPDEAFSADERRKNASETLASLDDPSFSDVEIELFDRNALIAQKFIQATDKNKQILGDHAAEQIDILFDEQLADVSVFRVALMALNH